MVKKDYESKEEIQNREVKTQDYIASQSTAPAYLEHNVREGVTNVATVVQQKMTQEDIDKAHQRNDLKKYKDYDKQAQYARNKGNTAGAEQLEKLRDDLKESSGIAEQERKAQELAEKKKSAK